MEGNKARSLAWMGVLTALLFTGQVVMSFLPNLEIVSLLIILYTIFFGMWWFQYLYIWSILAMVVLLLRHNTSALFWSIISGFFGLSFGALCTLPYLFTGGPAAAFSYWVSGLGFDLTHCIGNVVLCLVLFKPLYALLQKVFPA